MNNQASQAEADSRETTADLRQKLSRLLGPEQVFDDPHSCSLYAQDVFFKGQPAALVIRPSEQQLLQQAIQLIVQSGFKVIPRGGGMSYTKGYVPIDANTVLIDMSQLNRVIEINRDDMYVRVEAGCSWQNLYQSLRGSGFRTPYWGTLSGIFATVGGSISQNSIFWGSGQFGFAVDSVLSLKVILSEGNIIETGSAAQHSASPFMRHYGPDLTGLFCGDCSALGIKSEVTLRLIPEYSAKGYLSFCFDSFEQQSRVMSEVSRRNLAMECFGFDPYLQAQRLKRESLASDVKSLVGVVKSAGGVAKGIKEGFKVALAGRRFVEAESWSVHFMVEDITQAGVDDRIAQIRAIAEQQGANEIENSIPKILRANPFNPVTNMIGPNGERWAPVHALVPHSKAQQVYQLTDKIFSQYHQQIEQSGISVGYLVATVSTHVFVVEPVFFWPDELNEIHHFAIDTAHINKVKGFAAAPETRELVTAIRNELIAEYQAFGAIHMQIGKAYQFKQGIAERNYRLLEHIKAFVDPNGQINPGVLGLAANQIEEE